MRLEVLNNHVASFAVQYQSLVICTYIYIGFFLEPFLDQVLVGPFGLKLEYI